MEVDVSLKFNKSHWPDLECKITNTSISNREQY